MMDLLSDKMDRALKLESKDNVQLTTPQIVSSYNWLSTEVPTIAVPGMPAKWINSKNGPILEPDKESRGFTDQNAAKNPTSPFESEILAVIHLQTNYNFTHLDIITDRWAIGCLLELANYKKSLGHGFDQSFSFGVQVVGKTIIFVRDDREATQKIASFPGFRKGFVATPLAYAEGFKASASHHRLNTYRIGDLHIMMRYRVDGYVCDGTVKTEATTAEDKTSAENQLDGDTQVQAAGTLVPHSALLELNTTVDKFRENLKIKKKFREAWLSQAEHFVVAKWQPANNSRKNDFWRMDHAKKRGVFPTKKTIFYQANDIKQQAGVEFNEVIETYYDILLKLVRDIRIAVEAGEGSTFVVRGKNGDKDVEIAADASVPVLPEQLSDRIGKSFE